MAQAGSSAAPPPRSAVARPVFRVVARPGLGLAALEVLPEGGGQPRLAVGLRAPGLGGGMRPRLAGSVRGAVGGRAGWRAGRWGGGAHGLRNHAGAGLAK